MSKLQEDATKVWEALEERAPRGLMDLPTNALVGVLKRLGGLTIRVGDTTVEVELHWT